MNSQNMGVWIYIRECLTFGVKKKLRSIWGHARGFFSMCTEFVHLPSFQCLNPCPLQILDARMMFQCYWRERAKREQQLALSPLKTILIICDLASFTCYYYYTLDTTITCSYDLFTSIYYCLLSSLISIYSHLLLLLY